MGKITELKRIYNHFGRDNQLAKLKEEMIELYQEIEKISTHHKIHDHFFEELADVMIVCHQFYIQYQSVVEKHVDHKIKRTLKRIRKGYYSATH